MPVQTDGDVRARLVVRALELIESCRILRQVMRDMPDGPIAASSGSPRSRYRRARRWRALRLRAERCFIR